MTFIPTQTGFMRLEDSEKRMQNATAYVGIDEYFEVPTEEGLTQAFEQILSSALPSFYKQTYRLLGRWWII